MAEEVQAMGVPPSRVVVEPLALDTRDNAVYCAAIVARMGRTRVALVTSADHMARARAALWRLGIATLPVPAGPPYRPRGGWDVVLPDARALERTTNAVHEIVGLTLYGLRGWIGPPA